MANLYVFECNAAYEAGVIVVVAQSEEHAVKEVLEYSKQISHNEKDGYNFYIKPNMVRLESATNEERFRTTLWVLDRSKTIKDVKHPAGVWLHIFHDG